MVHFITCMKSMVDTASAYQVPCLMLWVSTLLFTGAVASGLLYHWSYRCTCLNHKLELCGQDSVHAHMQLSCVYLASIFDVINLYVGILNAWHYVREKITSRVAVRGDSGVAYEGKVVGISKFYFWVKCTIPMLPLAFVIIIGLYYLYYAGPLFHILGCNYLHESFNLHLWV